VKVRGLVAEKARTSQGRISAKRLLPAARAAGYEGSARNFRRLVAGVKSGQRPAVLVYSLDVRRGETAPDRGQG
jgi:hypothetical protein